MPARSGLLMILALAIAAPATAQTPIRPPGGFVLPAPPPPPASPKPLSPASPPYAGRLTLQGLPDRTDAAPACRAQCARSRAQCEAVDDACGPVWSACLRRCAAAK